MGTRRLAAFWEQRTACSDVKPTSPVSPSPQTSGERVSRGVSAEKPPTFPPLASGGQPTVRSVIEEPLSETELKTSPVSSFTSQGSASSSSQFRNTRLSRLAELQAEMSILEKKIVRLDRLITEHLPVMYGWASIAVLRQVRGRRYSAHCGRLSMSVKKKAQADQAEGGNCESDNPVMKPSIEQPSVTAKSRRPQLFYADDFPPPTSIELQVIGHIQSPYKERFGTPRQATVTEQTLGGKPQRAQIQLVDDARFTLALRGLAGFSRIWIISWMHLNTGWTPLVRPPRGPRKKQGLFATRSPHRPNQIALSCVEVEHVDESSRTIHVVGIDLIDRTPVLDIKPYIVYADSFPAARGGWLDKLDEPMNAPDFLSYSPPPQRLLSNSEPRGVSENQQQDKNKTN